MEFNAIFHFYKNNPRKKLERIKKINDPSREWTRAAKTYFLASELPTALLYHKLCEWQLRLYR